MDAMKEEYKPLHQKVKKLNKSALKMDQVKSFIERYEHLESATAKKNRAYVNAEMDRCQSLFDDIDGKSLDRQQREAVVFQETNQLVLAGAGSGKTLTISAKVKYLVDELKYKPEEVLLISFTKNSAEEMEQRIKQKLGIPVEVKTFHKMGLEIIKKCEGHRPDVADDDFFKLAIDEFFTSAVFTSEELVHSIVEFFACYMHLPKNHEEFDNTDEFMTSVMGDQYDTLRGSLRRIKQDLEDNNITLYGEYVKSHEELMIANYLYLNGIQYEYERLYPFKSDDAFRKQYRPDFYLPEYDLYLEHFGVDEKGNAPYLSKIEEQKYREGMVWKRGFHQSNGTVLLETYSYFNSQGVLLQKLEVMLKKHHVELRPLDRVALYKQLNLRKSDRQFGEFKKLLSTFISLFKSNGYDANCFEMMEREYKSRNKYFEIRTKLFFNIVKPLYEFYQSKLNESGSIDFNDMINKATGYVKADQIKHTYRYIMIDEYQDISQSRYRLIKAIKQQTSAKIMCVGDDWQSIYRFAGSDISLFTNFERYFGFYALSKIEKTYRNSQELIDIASRFVQKNPAQMRKKLISDKHLDHPVVIMDYDSELSRVKSLCHVLDKISMESGENTDVLLLGRNTFDFDDFLATEFFRKINTQGEFQYSKNPKLKLIFLTAHKSKGLEGTAVVIINAMKSRLGFPNQMTDDPLLNLVLTSADGFRHTEERRLFYVSLTRTKTITYILSPKTEKSIFVSELEKYPGIILNDEFLNPDHKDMPKCPRCHVGYLVKRQSDKGKSFVGCSNYPMCDYTLNEISVLTNPVTCSVCGGFMVKRSGRYGKFMGCTNYPTCGNNGKV